MNLNLAPKTVATGLTGFVAIILTWSLAQFHIVMPGEVAIAFATLLMTAASYFAPRSHPPPVADNPTTNK